MLRYAYNIVWYLPIYIIVYQSCNNTYVAKSVEGKHYLNIVNSTTGTTNIVFTAIAYLYAMAVADPSEDLWTVSYDITTIYIRIL